MRRCPIQLQIPVPCTQHWDDMIPVKDGRFCESCAKKVVDFSLLNDQQILDIIRNGSQSGCGRFTDDQLNRLLIEKQKSPVLPAIVLGTALTMATCTYADGSTIKPVPVMVRDTIAPVTDSITACQGYMALKDGLDVNAYKVKISTYTTGTLAVITATEVKAKKKKRWYFLWII